MDGKRQSAISRKNIIFFLSGVAVLCGLYLTSRYSYLLFHGLAEVFSIVVACGIFMFFWNARRFLDDGYFLFIGIAYLFVGGLDLIHTLAYKGTGVFPGYDANLPTQLWVAARYVESLSLLAAPLFLRRSLKPGIVFIGYVAVVSLLLGSIFYWNVFPDCFVEGAGLTPFKKSSEYIISLILLASIVLMFRKRREFDTNVFQFLTASIVVTIGSESAFTLYTSVYGLPNLIGHLLKIVSFYLIYKAFIEVGLTKPYTLLFRNSKQSEEALRESGERFRQLAENIQDAFWLGTPDTGDQRRVLYASPAMEKIFGIKREELYQSDSAWLETIHEEDRDRTLDRLERFLQDQDDYNVEYRVVRPDGTVRWIWSRGFGIRNEKGEIYRTCGLAQDITERKQMEEALQEREERLQSLFTTMTEGVVLIAPDGQIAQANPAAEHILGLRRSEIEGRNYVAPDWEIFRPNGTPMPPEEMAGPRAMKEKRPVKNVVTGVKRSDGSISWIDVSAAPLVNEAGETQGVVGTFTDITERVRTEEALRQYATELEASNEELDAFAHTVAHDLKNPLARIIGFAEALERDYITLPDEELRRYLHTMAQNGRKMDNIIDELLLLATVRQMEEVGMGPLDMGGIVAEAQGRLTDLIEERQAEIVTPLKEAWPVVLGYAPWVEEVWVNYLSNALKYGGDLPRVELGFSILDLGLRRERSVERLPILDSSPQEIQSKIQNQKSKIAYWVRDNGPGLTPEEQERLFTPFTQLDPRTWHVKGHGLGLSIVRRIVEKLGGEVGVESQVGQGSVFWFTLPSSRHEDQ